MTDREKAIVMAYTGICMLTGDKFQIFHKYVEDIMGRPIWTHEMGIKSIEDEIKAKSKADFIALCADESSSENPSKWVSAKDRLPEDKTYILTTIKIPGRQPHSRSGWYHNGYFLNDNGDAWNKDDIEVIAWMPLPEPYVESEE